MDKTHSHLPVSGIDYFSEEYVKQVIQNSYQKKLSQLLPFIGSVAYPSDIFPDRLNNDTERQFKDTLFIGFMEFLFPDLTQTGDPAYTAIKFKLDGIDRQFIVVRGGTTDMGVEIGTFADFVAGLYPDYNSEIPFGVNIHLLSDLSIESKSYALVEAVWTLVVAAITTPQTDNFKFGFTCSGYKALMQ